MRARFKARQIAPARIDELIAADRLGEVGDGPDAELHGSGLLQIFGSLGEDLADLVFISRGGVSWHCSSAGSSPAMTRPDARSSRSTKLPRTWSRRGQVRPRALSGQPKDFPSTTMVMKTRVGARLGLHSTTARFFASSSWRRE